MCAAAKTDRGKRFFLNLLAAPGRRKRTSHAVERLGDGGLPLFLLLDLVPAFCRAVDVVELRLCL